jgi:Concanavalin A-like lectin/glucanases superfamily
VTNATPFVLVALALSACAATPAGAPGGPAAPAAPSARPSYSATVLTDGPAGYWRMGETSGTTMIDATKNGNDGTYAGAVKLGQSGALAGDKATAVAFDGHSAEATVPSSPSLKLTQVTIELWIKKTSDSGYGIYVAKDYFELLNNSFTGRLEFRLTASADPALVSSTTLALNTWYYVVATYDGTTASLYINGQLDSAHPAVATPAPIDGPVSIGRRFDGFFNNAVLEEIAIYPTALSADRVATHWRVATAGR